MIDEAIGKIIGMAMAYFASVLGMFLAYVNYRKRIMKADKVMTGAAWTVVLVTVLAVLGGLVVVGKLAKPPAETPAVETAAPAAEPAPTFHPPEHAEEESRWPWVGILVPAVIFLGATWVTGGLYRHFATHGHGGPG